jgi:hypothetical protein
VHGKEEEREGVEREEPVGDDDDAPSDASWNSHWKDTVQDHN